MATLIDSCVLLDVFTEETVFGDSGNKEQISSFMTMVQSLDIRPS